VLFERVKAPKIDDRKWHCIELILCHCAPGMGNNLLVKVQL
jgi:hypothetical protein